MKHDIGQVPVLTNPTGIARFDTLENLVRKYRRAEQHLQHLYETPGYLPETIDDAEAKAQDLLDRIEAMHAAIEEGGEGDEWNEPFTQAITADFALRWNEQKDDPELYAFLERGGTPVRHPPSMGVSTRGEPVPLEGYDEYPTIVQQLRHDLSSAGMPWQEVVAVPPVRLIEAAEDAYQARAGLTARIRSHAGRDPVGVARRWLHVLEAVDEELAKRSR